MFIRNDFFITALKLSRILGKEPKEIEKILAAHELKEEDRGVYQFNDVARVMREAYERKELAEKIHSWFINKGGVGKTVHCFNTGAYLALQGYQVLFIDLDPQTNISCMLTGFSPEELAEMPNTLKETLMEQKGIQECIHHVAQNIDLIPGHFRIQEAASYLNGKATGVHTMMKLFKQAGLKKRYDYIAFDNNSASSILSDNALLVSDSVISVTEPEQNSLNGLAPISGVIEDIRDGLSKEIQWRILLNNLDLKIGGEKKLAKQTYELFGEHVFRNYIKKSADFGNATRLNAPFFCFSGYNSNALKDYQSFIGEFIDQIAAAVEEVPISTNQDKFVQSTQGVQ